MDRGKNNLILALGLALILFLGIVFISAQAATTTATSQADVDAARIYIQTLPTDLSKVTSPDLLVKNLDILLNNPNQGAGEKTSIVNGISLEVFQGAANADKDSKLMNNGQFRARFTAEAQKDSGLLNRGGNEVSTKNWLRAQYGVIDGRGVDFSKMDSNSKISINKDGTLENSRGVVIPKADISKDKNIALKPDGIVAVGQNTPTEIRRGVIDFETHTIAGTTTSTLTVTGKTASTPAELTLDPLQKDTTINLKNARVYSRIPIGSRIIDYKTEYLYDSIEFGAQGGTYTRTNGVDTLTPKNGGTVTLAQRGQDPFSGSRDASRDFTKSLITDGQVTRTYSTTGKVTTNLGTGNVQFFDNAQNALGAKINNGGTTGVVYMNPAEVPFDIGTITGPTIGVDANGKLICANLGKGQNIDFTTSGKGVNMNNIDPDAKFKITTPYGGTITRDENGLRTSAKGPADISFREDMTLTKIKYSDGKYADLIGIEQHPLFARNYDTWQITTNPASGSPGAPQSSKLTQIDQTPAPVAPPAAVPAPAAPAAPVAPPLTPDQFDAINGPYQAGAMPQADQAIETIAKATKTDVATIASEFLGEEVTKTIAQEDSKLIASVPEGYRQDLANNLAAWSDPTGIGTPAYEDYIKGQIAAGKITGADATSYTKLFAKMDAPPAVPALTPQTIQSSVQKTVGKIKQFLSANPQPEGVTTPELELKNPLNNFQDTKDSYANMITAQMGNVVKNPQGLNPISLANLINQLRAACESLGKTLDNAGKCV